MEDGYKIYKPNELSKLLGVTNECLRIWGAEGKIKFTTTEGGHRRYIYKVVEKDERMSIIYARVSSSKQQNDLQRQVNYLKEQFPNYEVITDIGSGLNFKRKGLLRVLECLFSGNIKEVVVAHKDRLCRFGYEIFEFMFQKHGVVLRVLENEGIKSPINEFAEDVLSIVTVFTARYYGSRKNKILQKDKNLSITGTDPTIQQVSRSKSLLLQQGKRIRKIKISGITSNSKDRKR
jgi:predicted site-specific integrase-resolvase